jgi:5,10-methylenetetrahydrofolate reductase
MSKLEEAFKKGKFAVTSEIGPPKGTEINRVLEENDSLKERVEAINVTDLQSSVMRLGSLVVSKLLLDRGIEPVFQLTCRDRNRLALQSDLLSAAVFGIENCLILTGDYPSFGDHPEAKPVFDLDSVQLLRAVQSLEEGKDLAGKQLSGAPKFFTGAVVNPGADPLEPELIKMEKKIKAGAQFFQTQAVYEVEKFKNFIQQTKHFGVPVMAGIVLLKSAAMARYMNDNVAGVYVPEELIKKMGSAKDKVAASIEIAKELINELRPFCQGVHIMPIGWDRYVGRVLDAAGL